MVLYIFYQPRIHSKSTLENGLAEQPATRKVGSAHRLHKTATGPYLSMGKPLERFGGGKFARDIAGQYWMFFKA